MAGITFDEVYTTVYESSVKENKGLHELRRELNKIPQEQKEGKSCEQNTDDPVSLFIQAAKTKPKARAAIEDVGKRAYDEAKRQKSTAVLQKPAGPLKRMGRIIEKASFLPIPQLSVAALSIDHTALLRRSRCAQTRTAAGPNVCATLCEICSSAQA